MLQPPLIIRDECNDSCINSGNASKTGEGWLTEKNLKSLIGPTF